MITIVIAIVLFFTFGELIGEKAKKKGYNSLGFRFLVAVSYFGVIFLSLYLLNFILEDDASLVGAIFLGIAASYLIPDLIIKKLPYKNNIDAVKSNVDHKDKDEVNI